jgi:Zn-dependent peptidase ImmA (M78 family)
MAATLGLPRKKRMGGVRSNIAHDVIGVEDVPGLSKAALAQLTKHDHEAWSALMMAHRGVNIIVMNTAHSERRQSSSLAHECSAGG